MGEGKLLIDALALCREGKWDAAHKIVQQDNSRLSAWLHGVIHQEEGDLSNALYWFNRAGRREPNSTIADELDRFEYELVGSNVDKL